DLDPLDRALSRGCTLGEVAAGSRLRLALTELAGDLVGVAPPAPPRRLRRS
ncbi:MAG: hypothetical protein QOJ50_2200, partial [Cryptosporangiaceae bacterium]|nr:hypothetical protein [Cryptosporangiaceae bacterium]